MPELHVLFITKFGEFALQVAQTPPPNLPAPGEPQTGDVGSAFVNALFTSPAGGSVQNSNRSSGGDLP
jgi:hypothetical protein